MSAHKCPRCGYETNRIADFKKHLNRKKLCDPDIADVSLDETKNKYYPQTVTLFDCTYCYKGFKTKHGCKYHMLTCKRAPSTSISLNDINKIKDEILTQVKEIFAGALSIAGPSDAISQINNILDTHIDKIENTVINNHVDKIENTIIENNVENNINITINNFGAEPICHLLDDVDFMKSCFKNYEYGLIDFIVRKWFDPKHPENHCLEPFIGGMVRCFENGSWCAKTVNERFLDSVMNYVGCDYQSFLERNPVFEKKFLDEFMKKIGVPLEWDLDHGAYEFEGMSLDQKAKAIRERLHRLVSKQVFKA